MNRGLVGIATLGALLAASGSVMLVDSDEVAVVYRFGEVVRTVDAGLAFRLPGPLESDQRIRVSEIRRVETGQMRLLTGDTNLVELDLTVQYSVADPVAFALQLFEPEAVVAAQVQATAAQLVSSREVDVLLTTGRSSLQIEVASQVQLALDALKAGVRIEAIEVRALVPPSAVVDAFNDVSSARGDKETMVLAAHAYASKLLPDTRGKAQQRSEEAQANASERRAHAKAQTARFRAVHAGYRASPAATKWGLRSKTLERVSDKTDVVVAPAGTEVVLPPLKESP